MKGGGRKWIGLATPSECCNFINPGTLHEIYFPICASPKFYGALVEPGTPECPVSAKLQDQHSYPCYPAPCPVIKTWTMTEGAICLKPTNEGKFSVEFVINELCVEPSDKETYTITALPSFDYSRRAEVNILLQNSFLENLI